MCSDCIDQWLGKISNNRVRLLKLIPRVSSRSSFKEGFMGCKQNWTMRIARLFGYSLRSSTRRKSLSNNNRLRLDWEKRLRSCRLRWMEIIMRFTVKLNGSKTRIKRYTDWRKTRTWKQFRFKSWKGKSGGWMERRLQGKWAVLLCRKQVVSWYPISPVLSARRLMHRTASRS